MRHMLIAGAVCATLLTATAADAGERTLTGVAIGAGAGAIVAGPVGAVAGGALGAWVGGPRISRGHKHCWHDRYGHRHCRWR